LEQELQQIKVLAEQQAQQNWLAEKEAKAAAAAAAAERYIKASVNF